MPDPKKFTVMIVDDETALREALVFDFKRRGFTVLEASHGREAFELVKNNLIDVILSDVQMPGGDGIELLENVKSLHPDLPVVMFITGYADISVQESYDRGAEAIFSKPFDRNVLVAAVMRAILTKDVRWSSSRNERINADFKIVFRFPELDLAIQGKVLNIGFGGFFISLKEEFPVVGTTIDFSIQFDVGQINDLTGHGIVRWVRQTNTLDQPSGCGIEFEFLSDDSRSQVIQLINELKTKSFIPIS